MIDQWRVFQWCAFQKYAFFEKNVFFVMHTHDQMTTDFPVFQWPAFQAVHFELAVGVGVQPM